MTAPEAPAQPALAEEEFESRLRSMGRAVVLFKTTHCGFCHRFEPAFRQAAAEHGGLAFVVARIDEDADTRWDRYGVQAVPTVVYFEDGAPAARVDSALGVGIRPAEWRRFLAALPPAAPAIGLGPASA